MARTVQFAEYGDSDVLQVMDAPAPTPRPRQVRVTVQAAGVNPVDWKTVGGLPRPVPRGLDYQERPFAHLRCNED
jgi:NADPH:quinone reductase-like Zn-dependent oxidoreductase